MLLSRLPFADIISANTAQPINSIVRTEVDTAILNGAASTPDSCTTTAVQKKATW